MEGYLLVSLLAPVPIFHFWLHALLPYWRKCPWLFYVWGVVVWMCSFLFFWHIENQFTSSLLEMPVGWQNIGLILQAVAVISIVYAIYRIGVLNFFVWGALNPKYRNDSKKRTIHWLDAIPHLGYIGYLLFVLGAFLDTGKVYILFVLIFLCVLLPVVMYMEDHELAQRFGKTA